MSTQYYRNGKVDLHYASPRLHMYRDGDAVPVPLGATAKAYLDREGRPQNNPSDGGIGILREVLIDFTGQQVWDEDGNNIPVYLYDVHGQARSFVVAETDGRNRSADIYIGHIR